MDYDDLRTGLTFSDVAAGLREEARQVYATEGRIMFLTRRTVLGRWRQIKLGLWDSYRRNQLSEDT